MDPKACYERILSALEDHDLEEAEEAIEDYRGWLSKGGFPHDKVYTNFTAQVLLDGISVAINAFRGNT